MKKIIFFILIALVSVQSFGKKFDHKESWFTALSSGYVFKNDDTFKEVYGHGMINTVTADGCYYPWKHLGFGIKTSYWRAKGRTTFLNQRAIAQEVPTTIYLSGKKKFDCGLQIQGSLGGGFSWLQEKSYLNHIHTFKGIGEVEVGLNYSVWRCINVIGAFRYIFPPQSQEGKRVDVGGCDLRAGIGFSF